MNLKFTFHFFVITIFFWSLKFSGTFQMYCWRFSHFVKNSISPLSYCWDEECRQALCWYMCSRCRLWRCRSWGMGSQIRNVIHIIAKNSAAPHQPNWQNIQAFQNEVKKNYQVATFNNFCHTMKFFCCASSQTLNVALPLKAGSCSPSSLKE